MKFYYKKEDFEMEMNISDRDLVILIGTEYLKNTITKYINDIDAIRYLDDYKKPDECYMVINNKKENFKSKVESGFLKFNNILRDLSDKNEKIVTLKNPKITVQDLINYNIENIKYYNGAEELETITSLTNKNITVYLFSEKTKIILNNLTIEQIDAINRFKYLKYTAC